MNFIRLNITVEGLTELGFVSKILTPYLGNFQISTDARAVMTSKEKSKTHRGGLISYEKAKKDITTWLKEDANPEARFSTMFDLYALPKDFPEYETAQKLNDPYKKVRFLEEAMWKDIDDRRFIPYIQLHEFEALVFADPKNLELEYFENEKAIRELEKQLEAFGGNPELINEGKETAPSKRIKSLIPEYDKAGSGAIITNFAGMDFLRKKCLHFGEWISQLENLAATGD